MAGKSTYDLIRKYFENNLPKEVRLKFQRWMMDETDKEEKEKAIEMVWEEASSSVDERIWADLNHMHKRIRPSISPGKTWRSKLYRIAAIFLLPIIGALSMYLYTSQHPLIVEPVWKEHFVPNGKQEHLSLSDGTEVWLNSGSLLLYTENFVGDERSVYLNGEASFHVTKNPQKPFLVRTKYLETEVLGTLFNVEAYSNSELIKITLEEGKIKVNENENMEHSFTVNPNEQVVYDPEQGTMTKEVVDASRVLQWKHGYLVFQEASLDHILKTIERRYDVTINYETGKYPGRKFTMRFRPDEGLHQVLEILKEMVPDLHYKIKNGIIYVQ